MLEGNKGQKDLYTISEIRSLMVQQIYFCSVKDIVTLCSKQHMTVEHTDRTVFNCRVNLENIKKSQNKQPNFSDFGCIIGGPIGIKTSPLH